MNLLWLHNLITCILFLSTVFFLYVFVPFIVIRILVKYFYKRETSKDSVTKIDIGIILKTDSEDMRGSDQ